MKKTKKTKKGEGGGKGESDDMAGWGGKKGEVERAFLNSLSFCFSTHFFLLLSKGCLNYFVHFFFWPQGTLCFHPGLASYSGSVEVPALITSLFPSA